MPAHCSRVVPHVQLQPRHDTRGGPGVENAGLGGGRQRPGCVCGFAARPQTVILELEGPPACSPPDPHVGPRVFVAGQCPRCRGMFTAVAKPVGVLDRFCTPTCRKVHLNRERIRRRKAETAEARAAERRRWKLAFRDFAGLFDLDSWRRTKCPRCGKASFPTLERAAFQACMWAASTGRRMKPYYAHGLWHLTSRGVST